MEQANEYIARRTSDPFPSDARFPVWMWQNQVMLEVHPPCNSGLHSHLATPQCNTMMQHHL